MTENHHWLWKILATSMLFGTGCGSDDSAPTYTVRFETDGTPGASLVGEVLQEVDAGSSTALVKAVPPPGYVFTDWRGGAASTQSAVVIPNVQQDMTLRAVFRTQRVRYVDAAATGQNTGDTWTDAYPQLAPALASAQAGDEVWVAAGTYHPTTGAAETREHHFSLKNGVGVFGGFHGTESSRTERTLAANASILSCDIGVAGDPADNCYQVIENVGVDATAVLDRFTITGGNANGSAENSIGGGIYNHMSSPTLRNLVLVANAATFHGGAIGNYTRSSPTLINCLFLDNTAALGACHAMENFFLSKPTITNSTFVGPPGAICNTSASADTASEVTITNSILWVDSAVQNTFGSSTIRHSVVKGSPTGSAWKRSYGIDGGHNIDADPMFIDPVTPGGDWRLKPGSPAIDAGTSLPFDSGGVAEDMLTDLDGNPRVVQSTTNAPRVDLGAYEEQAAAACQYRPSTGIATVKALSPLKEDPSVTFMTYDFVPANTADFQWLGLPDDGTKVTVVAVQIATDCVTRNNLTVGSTIATAFRALTQGTCNPLLSDFTGLPEACW